MYFDYPPTINNAEFDQWAQHLVDTLRVGEWEIQTLEVTNFATINQYRLGQVGSWDITENTLTNGTIVIDSAQNRITVDTIIIDGAENEIRVGGTNIVLDGDDEKIKVGSGTPYLDIDGGNTRIRSSNYVTGVLGSGFTLEPDLLEVGNIAARGIIRSAVFQREVNSVVGGQLLILPGDVLSSDMTAADNSTLTIEGNETFSVGDILRIKDGVEDEWFEVTNIASAPTYTVTRDKAGVYGADANPAWKKGATVVNFGQSGDGYVNLNSSGSNTPRITVGTHAGSPWTGPTEHAKMGNLNGSYGISADKYGFAAGDSSLTNHYIIINGTDGTVEVKGAITVTGGDAFSKTTDDLDDVSDGTTYGRVNTTSISAGKIVLGGIDGSTGTLNISSSGALEISSSSGLKIKSGGDIEVQSGGDIVVKTGGDIVMEPDDSSPSKIIFEDSGAGTYDVEIARETTLDLFYVRPTTDNTCLLFLGNTSNRFDYINIYAGDYVLASAYYNADNFSRIRLDTGNGSGNDINFTVENSTTQRSLKFQYTDFSPTSHKSIDLGKSGTGAWAEAYADNWNNVADFYHLDNIDDLAAICQIKGSGIIDKKTGLELIDDDTLPEFLLAKSKDGKEILRDPDGKPYIPLKTALSLLFGAVRQMYNKINGNPKKLQ